MINICLMHWHRDLLHIILFYLNKIKEENKSKIKVSILTQNWQKTNVLDYSALAAKMLKGINFQVIGFDKGMNYFEKTKWIVKQNFEYVMKHDEDVFLNNHIYDYIIENVNILDDKNNLFLAPVLSTGIPTVEYFAEEQLTKEERDKLYKFFLQEIMLDKWGAPGKHLNQFTIHATEWDGDSFYKEVDKIFHYYRGTHPIRFSYEAQKYINELILEKFEQFTLKQDYKTIAVKRPYFCNSCFVIKQDIYKNINENLRYRKDIFDEVPLNSHMSEKKLNMVFIKNSFGIHIRYRACSDSRIDQVESTFGKAFTKKVLPC